MTPICPVETTKKQQRADDLVQLLCQQEPFCLNNTGTGGSHPLLFVPTVLSKNKKQIQKPGLAC